MEPLISDEDLAEFRQLAEDQMTETCTITRVDPEAPAPEMDPDTLEYPDPPRITIYSGKCRIQIKSVIASANDSEAGERRVVNQDVELQLPVDGTADVTIGDVAGVVTAVSDDSLVGREFTVRARHEKSQATARRLRVTEGVG